MMSKRDFIKRALDANAIDTGVGNTLGINPSIWDRDLRAFQEANLLVTKLAEQHDFTGPGKDYTVTVDGTPAAAEAATEGVAGTVYAISTRQVTYTPTEYIATYELTKNEAVRGFYNLMSNITKKIGYQLAIKKDSVGYEVIKAGAGNVVYEGSGDENDLTDADTITLASINKGIRLNEEDFYVNNSDLLVSYKQKQDLLDLTQIQKSNEFGTRDAIARGFIGELFGLNVFATHSVVGVTNTASTPITVYAAVIVGKSQSGEKAYGYAVKQHPTIESQYQVKTRHWDIVGNEEYDFKVLHPNALCLIWSA